MSDPMVLNKPLVVMFEHDERIICHLWPRESDTYQGFGLLACDLVRHIANAFKVEENAVWEWVDKERRRHTTGITRPS